MQGNNINEIEKITFKQVEEAAKYGKAEKINIKDHDVYLVDFGGYFGYSALVFKNQRHIRFANDYELHHNGKTADELRDFYIERLNKKLFTEAEIMESVKSYDDYKRKDYYIRNYWIMQFKHYSIFGIGEPSKEFLNAKKNGFYSKVCFSYVMEKSIAERAEEMLSHVEKSYTEIMSNDEVFRSMIAYELANHEAGITYSAREALNE